MLQFFVSPTEGGVVLNVTLKIQIVSSFVKTINSVSKYAQVNQCYNTKMMYLSSLCLLL